LTLSLVFLFALAGEFEFFFELFHPGTILIRPSIRGLALLLLVLVEMLAP
jgi:hypothetical protein